MAKVSSRNPWKCLGWRTLTGKLGENMGILRDFTDLTWKNGGFGGEGNFSSKIWGFYL